jgi:hypothetical protein
MFCDEHRTRWFIGTNLEDEARELGHERLLQRDSANQGFEYFDDRDQLVVTVRFFSNFRLTTVV